MSSFTLDGSIRSDLGSANANRLRKGGSIPAVIYGDGGNEAIFVSVVKKDFDKEYLKGGITTKVIALNIDKKVKNVLTYQIDLDPLSDMPRHIDFICVDGKKEVKAEIPVKYFGQDKSPGMKKGGFLNILKRKIAFYVNPKDIPSCIEVDVSALHIGSKITIENIKLPNGIKPVEKGNFNICSVTGRGKSDVETTTATTDVTATATAPTDATKTTPADAKAVAPTKTEEKKK